MPTVLITRPLEDAEELALKLADLGYNGAVEPLLILQANPAPTPDFTTLQAVMITSAHALEYLTTENSAGLLDRPCYCVGTHTAIAAKAFGFQTVYNAAGDGTALAERIIAQQKNATGVILHITGRDTDSRAREALEKAGFAVTPWAVYQAEAATALSGTTARYLVEAKIDAVLLFSARTAATLKQLISQHALQACCKNVIAIGISDTVVASLKGLPWRNQAAAAAPNEDSMLQCLQTLLPVPEVSHD